MCVAYLRVQIEEIKCFKSVGYYTFLCCFLLYIQWSPHGVIDWNAENKIFIRCSVWCPYTFVLAGFLHHFLCFFKSVTACLSINVHFERNNHDKMCLKSFLLVRECNKCTSNNKSYDCTRQTGATSRVYKCLNVGKKEYIEMERDIKKCNK